MSKALVNPTVDTFQQYHKDEKVTVCYNECRQQQCRTTLLQEIKLLQTSVSLLISLISLAEKLNIASWFPLDESFTYC